MRRVDCLNAILVAVTAGSCGGASYKAAARAEAAPTTALYAQNGGAAAPGGSTGVATASEPTLPEQLVIEAWLSVEVDDVKAAAVALRTAVEQAGGRVINEELGGAATSWSGRMSLRLPPGATDELFATIDKLGTITSKRVQASDVSKQLFDQELALTNLQKTMDRLQQLLAREGLEMKDVLAIETEMTRIRGEIERIKGEQRWLEDRVAFATVEVNLSRRSGVVLGPEAKFYPGARVSMLTLLDRNGRKRNRIGGGMSILWPQSTSPGSPARGGLELDVFPGPEGEKTAVVVTAGGAAYSDFLGRGKRRFLNPYLGLRLGYGYLDGSAFVFSGTAGIELFKHKYFMVDANVNLMGFVSDSFDSAVVTGGGAVFAF